MAEVEIKTSIKSRRLIRPSEKTWTGTMKLSEIDMSMVMAYVPKLYVYRGTHKGKWDPPSIAKTLEESLAKALVHYYPFMGRLRPIGGGRSELVVDDSNDATWGIPFVEANANVELGDDMAELEAKGRLRLLFPVVDYGLPLHERPLLMVQVTHFSCGSVAVAFAWSHGVVEVSVRATSIQNGPGVGMEEVEIKTSIKSRRLIRPSEKTWTGTMKLSEIDMSMAMAYVPKLYVYRGTHKGEWDPPSIAKTLEESLAKALVRYYPFMGRLRPIGGGRSKLVVDDSDDATWGIPFVEANADVELGDDMAELEAKGRLRLLFPVVDYGLPLHERPLLTVQVTHFLCGGVAIAFAWSHGVVDGIGAGHFYSEWTRLARGEPLGIVPLHDRSLLRAGEPPRSIPEFITQKAVVTVGDDDGVPPLSETTSVRLYLSKIQINKLKHLAGDDVNGRSYSRFEVLAAHVWRCASKARGHDGKKLNAIGISINIRNRIDPPLPQEFVGNAAISLSATSNTEDLVSNPLGQACRTVRQTIDKTTNELIWAYMDYQKSVDDLGAWRGIMTPEGSFVNPDVMVVSWLNLSFCNLDFGWGNEIYMASQPHGMEGVACLVEGHEDGETVVVICLKVAHVDKFKECFFEDLI